MNYCFALIVVVWCSLFLVSYTIQVESATGGEGSVEVGDDNGTLLITMHYPESHTTNNTYFLVTSDLTGWEYCDYIVKDATSVPIIALKKELIMKKSTEHSRWTYQVKYPDTYFDQTILIMIVVYENSTKSDAYFYTAGICLTMDLNNMRREIGKGHSVFLSDSGVTSVNIYPYFCIASGEVLQMQVPSLDNKQNVLIPVYVPPSLVENGLSRLTNVVFIYDGQLLNLDVSLNLFSIAAVSGGLPELVVVGVPSTANRMAELTPTVCVPHPSCVYMPDLCPAEVTGLFNNTLAFALQRALPVVLARLGLETVPSRTGSMGWSLGGLSACEAVFRSDAITLGLCGSPSMWWNCGEFMRRHLVHPPEAKLWLDGGSGEPSIALSATDTYHALSRIDGWSPGGNIILDIVKGAQHDISSWLQWDRTVEGLKFLFGDVDD